ncbi:phytanoyl-CoA dioxygenase family protein [Sphingomonas quercus]|uniref:Phytanoyl-CoA dioxygenase family protein n=1 Tax=Sphingomonas quercus TaxID=2842451 RepID=A0ABS6BG52_9SPHN|nr:phytanoyl-CoA dioxygenase family protein [Sphingomonas quercus]MBU3077149.1 phytanoyl-CoA dioxygenase family protein [Sphingomonas quercus]
MKAARYLLAPWWLVSLATGAKAFSDNPLIGSPLLNQAGLHAGRVWLASAMAGMRRRRLAHLVDAESRAAFDRDGFVAIRDFLSPDLFASLRDQVFAFPAAAREMVQGDTITRRIALDPEGLAAMPAARALLADPRWRGLIRYVGSYDQEPLTYVQTILSHRHDAPADPQETLHADTFHPTVKAWLFLTDVAQDEGPFTYVPGSHRLTPERLAWERARSLRARELDRLSARGSLRIQADELAALALPGPRALAVPANTLVVADTYGFHARGPSARPSTRVEIWAYGRRNPFLPWTGLDPLSLPGIAERRVPLMWAMHDRLRKWIGQPWADVGRKRAADS